MEEMASKAKRIRCGKCDFSTDRAIELARHIKALHLKIGSDSKCPDCEFGAATMSALLFHIKTTHRKLGLEEAKNNAEPERMKRHEITVEVPTVSYAQMICEALKPAKNRMLLHSEICAFISRKYPQYKMEEQSWQDDIRQTLSQKFKKVPRNHLHPPPINDHFSRTEAKQKELGVKADFNVHNPNVNDLAMGQGDGNDFNDIVDEELNESGDFHVPVEELPEPTFGDTAEQVNESYDQSSTPNEERKDHHHEDQSNHSEGVPAGDLSEGIIEPREATSITNMQSYVNANIYPREANGGNNIVLECPHCTVKLSSGQALASHIREWHGVKCPQCGIQVKSNIALEIHWRFCLESQDSGKTVAVEKYSKYGKFMVKASHNGNGTERSKTCSKCGLVTGSATDLYRHFTSVHSVKCPQCGIQLNSNIAMENHRRVCLESKDSGKTVAEENSKKYKIDASHNGNGTERIKQMNILKRNRPKGALIQGHQSKGTNHGAPARDIIEPREANAIKNNEADQKYHIRLSPRIINLH